jgi:hypothetical protein
LRSNPGEGLQFVVTAKPLTRRCAPTSPYGRGELNSRLPKTFSRSQSLLRRRVPRPPDKAGFIAEALDHDRGQVF